MSLRREDLTTFVELVHPSEVRTIPSQWLQDNCTIFQQDMTLLDSPYTRKSTASLNDLRDFVAVLEDRPIGITVDNFPGLCRLCDEFGCDIVSGRLLAFLSRGDAAIRGRISSLYHNIDSDA
jgi:hypothetical protein